MVSYIFIAIIFMQWSRMESKILSQTRWCPLMKDEGNDSVINWTAYDDSSSICVNCGNETQLFVDGLKTDTFLECCDGEKLDFGCKPTSCASVVLQCTDSTNSFCYTSQHCDGYNTCGNGMDEVRNMEITNQVDHPCNDCEQGQYQCSKPPTNPEAIQCFSPNHVCDGVKDCFTGSDEENCPYYGGRCPGFRCLTLPQCLTDRYKVCNGWKDCLDGSDELGCMKSDAFLKVEHCTTDYFMCDAKSTLDRPWNSVCSLKGIVKEKVCDGKEDCKDGKDEVDCFSWSQWSAWNDCDCTESKNEKEKSGVRLRTRKCFTFHDIMNHHKDKCSVDEAGAVEYNQCECVIIVDTTTTTPPADETTISISTASGGLSETVVIVIILSVVIIIVIITCGIYTLYINYQRKSDIIKIQHQVTSPQHMMNGTDSICGGIAPSIGSIASSQFVTSTLPMSAAAALPPNPNNRMSMASYQGNSLYKQRHVPLPPTPSGGESLYASIDEMHQHRIDPYAHSTTISPLSKRSMSLVSIDEIANPQALAETPYDIPRNDHENKPRSRKKGIRLIRAISRKMSIVRTPSTFRRALSNDQLNHNFASTRNILLKNRMSSAGRDHRQPRQLADIPDDPQSNYMTMCGPTVPNTPVDTISLMSRNTIDLTTVPPPPNISHSINAYDDVITDDEVIIDDDQLPQVSTVVAGRSDSFRRANKLVADPITTADPLEEASPGDHVSCDDVIDDDSSITWMKDEDEKKEDLYSRIIPKSLRRSKEKETTTTSTSSSTRKDEVLTTDL